MTERDLLLLCLLVLCYQAGVPLARIDAVRDMVQDGASAKDVVDFLTS